MAQIDEPVIIGSYSLHGFQDDETQDETFLFDPSTTDETKQRMVYVHTTEGERMDDAAEITASIRELAENLHVQGFDESTLVLSVLALLKKQ